MGKYFSIRELCASGTAVAGRIDNTPPAEAVACMESLIAELLDPVRELWGAPVKVNSGYRCPELNRAVGGASGSQHTEGRAADITVGSRKGNRELFDLIRKSGLRFDQLIDERQYSWIHISWSRTPRMQTLHL